MFRYISWDSVEYLFWGRSAFMKSLSFETRMSVCLQSSPHHQPLLFSINPNFQGSPQLLSLRIILMPILNLTQKCKGCHTWSHLPQDREEEGIFSFRLNIKSNLKIFHLLFERQPGNKEESSTISLFHWEWKILDESLSLFSLYI